MDKNLSQRTKRRRVQEEYKIYSNIEHNATLKKKNQIRSLNNPQYEIEGVHHSVPNKIPEYNNFLKSSNFLPPSS